ncbi:MAG: hypothetical protein ACD_23C00445G0001 [uncultured bacterium]|nr:MAG: hypothetical protein ACD_23C00445G0001 [uncultured bacterium]
MVVVGLPCYQLPQQLLHHAQITRLFGQHGLVVDQFVVLRVQVYQFGLNGQGIFV